MSLQMVDYNNRAMTASPPPYVVPTIAPTPLRVKKALLTSSEDNSNISPESQPPTTPTTPQMFALPEIPPKSPKRLEFPPASQKAASWPLISAPSPVILAPAPTRRRHSNASLNTNLSLPKPPPPVHRASVSSQRSLNVPPQLERKDTRLSAASTAIPTPSTTADLKSFLEVKGADGNVAVPKSHRQNLVEKANLEQEPRQRSAGQKMKDRAFFALVLLPLSCWYTRGGSRLSPLDDIERPARIVGDGRTKALEDRSVMEYKGYNTRMSVDGGCVKTSVDRGRLDIGQKRSMDAGPGLARRRSQSVNWNDLDDYEDHILHLRQSMSRMRTNESVRVR